MRILLPLLAAAVLATALVPATAAASPYESCTVSSWTWHLVVSCHGLFYEYVYLSWCPNDPSIYCIDWNILTCTVQTGRPLLQCPLSAILA